jgi:uncharacterized membrane protein
MIDLNDHGSIDQANPFLENEQNRKFYNRRECAFVFVTPSIHYIAQLDENEGAIFIASKTESLTTRFVERSCLFFFIYKAYFFIDVFEKFRHII